MHSNALPIITPCFKFYEIPYFWAGMKAYDLLAGTQALFWSSFMSARSARCVRVCVWILFSLSLSLSRSLSLSKACDFLAGTQALFWSSFMSARSARCVCVCVCDAGSSIGHRAHFHGIFSQRECARVCVCICSSECALVF